MSTNQANGLSHDAMKDLCAFIRLAKSNNKAMNLWKQHIQQDLPVIHATRRNDGNFVFSLAKGLAAFLDLEAGAQSFDVQKGVSA